jgi:hypothetical protein
MTTAEKNPKVLSTFLLVFVAGVATGALGMRLGFHEKLHPTMTASAASSPSTEATTSSQPKAVRANNAAVLQKFKTELNLSGDQTERIAAVLDDYRQYYQSLQDELDDIRATGNTRIMQILEPGQREKFAKIMSELQPQLVPK